MNESVLMSLPPVRLARTQRKTALVVATPGTRRGKRLPPNRRGSGDHFRTGENTVMARAGPDRLYASSRTGGIDTSTDALGVTPVPATSPKTSSIPPTGLRT